MDETKVIKMILENEVKNGLDISCMKQDLRILENRIRSLKSSTAFNNLMIFSLIGLLMYEVHNQRKKINELEEEKKGR